MANVKDFDTIKNHRTEFLADRSRIYTFEFEDGAVESFVLSASDIKNFLKSSYEKAASEGKTFGPDDYEDKREEYLLSLK
jgi:hypothetical protein